MKLNEVLKLDKVTGSIKKIDLFLAGTSRKSVDYILAFCYRNKILHHLGKTNEALKAIYALIPEFPKMSDEAVIAICDTIIEITLDINRLDQTKKYMDIKKKYLKVSTEVLGLKDDILYELASKNYHKAMELLKNYLNDEISHDQTIWALEELAKIEYSIHDYDSYLKTIEHLERNYKETFNTKQLIELLYSKLKISEERGNYIKVIRDGNALLNDYEVENELALKIAVMLIKSYLKCKDYHKATIIESNFEEKMNLVSNETALEFAKVCIELYTLKNSLFNVTHYQSLVEKYQQACKKALPKEKAKAKIIIPEVEEVKEEIEMEPVNPPSTLLEESYEPQKVLVSKQFMDLEQLFIILNQQSTMKFREVYRLAMIELAKIIPFEESYLLYYHQGYHGLHYKKERAYDKTIDMNALEDTINFLAISKNRVCFLDDETKEGRVDIVSREVITTPTYGIAIPLHMDKEYSYASIAYWSNKPFLGVELVYETLKLISQMMNKALIDDLNQQQLRSNNKKMFFIYENMTSGTKEMVDGQIHLSHQATEMLGIFEDITEQEFKNHIKTEDLPAYQALENEIYQLMPSSKSIEYGFMKNGEMLTIKETFFPYYENGNIILYSMLDDITHHIKLQDSLLAIAYTNPTSKLETEVKLNIDLNHQLNDKKVTLAILDVCEFKLYEKLYGINFVNKLIYAIALDLKSSFENQFNVSIYHLGFDRYAILFRNVNDKRTIDHLLIQALDDTAKKINMRNSKIHIYFNCGIYRVSKSQSITAEKVIEYAYNALTEAKENKTLEHHLEHYDSEKTQLRFNELQLVTHISESIDFGKIGLSYKQVVNLQTKEIFAYYANISLDNYDVDSSYMEDVIKTRKLEEHLDKYKISNASREVRLLREKINAKVFIMIDLSKDAIKDSLIQFIETQNQFYKTTKMNIIFIVEDGSHPVVMALRRMGYRIASRSLLDVYQEYIDYYIFDMERYGSVIVPELQILCENKKIELILSNIDTKEDMNRAIQMNIKYLYGNYYKKSIRMKKVIEKLS